MAKLRCKECGYIYSDQMTNCPECGCPSSESVLADEDSETKNVNGSAHLDNDQEDWGYIDVDSDNVFVGIFHWLSPKSISLPYNSKPMKVTVAVDNDAEDVFEIEKSLFYILHAFTLKLFLVYTVFFLIIGVLYSAITYMVYNTFEHYEAASIFLAILAFMGVILCVIICFMIFLYIFRPYWSHIHVRLRDLHIRHWRNVYRAIKKDEV